MTDPVQSSTIHVNGVDLASIAAGHGDPIVFVHGSFGDYRTFGLQVAPFAERHRVITYSRRYHWPNAQPQGDIAYAIAQQAADFAALIESLGPAPAHVVASCYGAIVAMTCAVDRPDLVRSLVLGEPPLWPWLARRPEGASIVEAFVASTVEPAGKALAAGDVVNGVRLFIDGVFGAGTFDGMPIDARTSALDNAAELRVETATLPELFYPAFAPESLERLRIPTLLVQGEVSPASFGLITDEVAHHLASAERVVIPAASHTMHADNPAVYSAAVLAFLAQH